MIHYTLMVMHGLNSVFLQYTLTERALCLGSQIGIAGRTGAGKSSILKCLFRLSAGSIVIDGVNTSHVALQRLRSRVTIVPHSPFLFGGSIR